VGLIKSVHEADCISNLKERSRELKILGDEIEGRNQTILYSGVANQALPLNRDIGGRWFDEIGWAPADLERGAVEV